MLEFIVLGQVPGTQLQITFTGLLLVALCVCLVALAIIETPRVRATAAKYFKKNATPAT